MIRRPPRSTQSRSSAASDVYKRQHTFTSSSPRKKRSTSRHGPPTPFGGRASKQSPFFLRRRSALCIATVRRDCDHELRRFSRTLCAPSLEPANGQRSCNQELWRLIRSDPSLDALCHTGTHKGSGRKQAVGDCEAVKAWQVGACTLRKRVLRHCTDRTTDTFNT